MVDGFRYWLNADQTQSIAFLFDSNYQAHIYSINVVKATNAYPALSIEEAVYKMAMNYFNGQSDN